MAKIGLFVLTQLERLRPLTQVNYCRSIVIFDCSVGQFTGVAMPEIKGFDNSDTVFEPIFGKYSLVHGDFFVCGCHFLTLEEVALLKNSM